TPDAEVRSDTHVRVTRVPTVVAGISQGNEEFAWRKSVDAWDYFLSLRCARTQGSIYRAPSVSRCNRVSNRANSPGSNHDGRRGGREGDTLSRRRRAIVKRSHKNQALS